MSTPPLGFSAQPTNTVTGDITLPALSIAGVISTTAFRQMSGAVTLPTLVIAGEIAPPQHTIEGAITLPTLRIEGVLGASPNRVFGHLVLPRLQIRSAIRLNAQIYLLTGKIRATGSGVFCFVGPPNRAIEWRIAVGEGQLYAEIDYTDQYGRASCVYVANGYSGPMTIEARYGG